MSRPGPLRAAPGRSGPPGQASGRRDQLPYEAARPPRGAAAGRAGPPGAIRHRRHAPAGRSGAREGEDSPHPPIGAWGPQDRAFRHLASNLPHHPLTSGSLGQPKSVGGFRWHSLTEDEKRSGRKNLQLRQERVW